MASTGTMPKSASSGKMNAWQPQSSCRLVSSSTLPRNSIVGPASDFQAGPIAPVAEDHQARLEPVAGLDGQVEALVGDQPAAGQEVVAVAAAPGASGSNANSAVETGG